MMQNILILAWLTSGAAIALGVAVLFDRLWGTFVPPRPMPVPVRVNGAHGPYVRRPIERRRYRA